MLVYYFLISDWVSQSSGDKPPVAKAIDFQIQNLYLQRFDFYKF